MSAMAAEEPIDIGVYRAQQMLDLMKDHPFVLLVFTEDGSRGFAKGLDPEAIAVINDMLNNAQA